MSNQPLSPQATALTREEQAHRAAMGQIANELTQATTFQKYLSSIAPNTSSRQRRDLELFANYLANKGIQANGEQLQQQPAHWAGLTHGLIEGFVLWQLQEGFAIGSINVRLATVRKYASLAHQAGIIEDGEALRIAAVSGYSRKQATNIDQQREQTRQGHKKAAAILLSQEEAAYLKQVHTTHPQAKRDALLLCLLLDHGLRASEAEILTWSDFDLAQAELQLFRPKTQTASRQKLTADTLHALYAYQTVYPEAERENGRLLLTTTRALNNGSGGELISGTGLNRIAISKRVALLGKYLGYVRKKQVTRRGKPVTVTTGTLSAHDCRHYCATVMARRGYSIRELCDWFGWTSPAMALRYIESAEVQERYKG